MVSHLRDKFVFIMGCDLGFRNPLARQLDLRGLRVLAACLTEQGAEQLMGQTSDRLETVILDVTKTESIAVATEWLKEQWGQRYHPDFFCVYLLRRFPKCFDFQSLGVALELMQVVSKLVP